MVLSSSKRYWESIKKLKRSEQQQKLNEVLAGRESIHSFSDIKLGDHLVQKSGPFASSGGFVPGIIQYEHHFLCIGYEIVGSEKRPLITHYYALGSKATITKKGRIEEATLGNDGFIGKENELQKKGREVSRVVWPDEYRRYSVGEIIARAKKCKEENLYDLMKNNCESFIMWCFCDLNISLQATPARETLYEMVWVVYAQLRQLVQQLPKLMSADYGDDVLIGALKAIDWEPFTAGQLAELGFYVGVSLPVLIEIGVAIHGIKQACKKWDNGRGRVYPSKEKFLEEVAQIVVLALFRSAGSTTGIFFGGFPGALLGIGVGHLLGKVFTVLTTDILVQLLQLLDTVINKIQEMKLLFN